MTPVTEFRFDTGAIIARPVRTPQGFLKLTGNLTRVGIQTYQKPAGPWRELRMPEEVFDQASLATLASVPVTDMHPVDAAGKLEMLTPQNATKHQRGYVGETVRQDGQFATASMIVTDAGLIAAIERRDRSELSPGYQCVVDATPGEWNGQRYDAVQRRIVYNHLAIGPRGWARGGKDVRLHVDGGDDLQMRLDGEASPLRRFVQSLRQDGDALAVQLGIEPWQLDGFLDGFVRFDSDVERLSQKLAIDPAVLLALVPPAETVRVSKQQRGPQTMKIRIDGIDIEVNDSAAPHVEKALKDRDSKIEGQKGTIDTTSARLDSVTAELTTVKGKLDAATKPEAVAALVAGRVALEAKARAVLGTDAKFDGKSDREIRLMVCAKANDKFDGTGRSDEYVGAYFDGIDAVKPAQTEAEKQAAAAALAQSRKGTTTERHDGDEAPNAERSRLAMIERNKKASQGSLSATRDAAK